MKYEHEDNWRFCVFDEADLSKTDKSRKIILHEKVYIFADFSSVNLNSATLLANWLVYEEYKQFLTEDEIGILFDIIETLY